MPILEWTGFFTAFSGLRVVAEEAVYSDETFHLCLLWAQVWEGTEDLASDRKG